jgi:type I restriction enzyme S subunit
LTDVARFVNGKAFTKDASGTGRVVVRIAELNSGLGGSTVYNDIEVADQHLARPGDLLFAWSGSLTLHRWFRPEAIVNQHIFKVIPQRGFPIWCAYGLISRKLDEFKAVAADKATTMGHIQRRHLEELVDVPTRAVMESNDDEMTTLWNRALLAEQESLTLGSLRDALLPELMAGRIRVNDAEMTVEEVL